MKGLSCLGSLSARDEGLLTCTRPEKGSPGASWVSDDETGAHTCGGCRVEGAGSRDALGEDGCSSGGDTPVCSCFGLGMGTPEVGRSSDRTRCAYVERYQAAGCGGCVV